MKRLILLTIFNSAICHGQIPRSCMIIDALLTYRPAMEPFAFDRNSQYPIVFVDTAYYFDDCHISSYYNREIRVSHDSSLIQIRQPSNYIIDVVHLKRKTYRVLLFYRVKGTHSWFTLKRKKNKYVVKKFEEGYL